MSTKIERLAVARAVQLGDWSFKMSIANFSNVMVMASDNKEHFMLRFFTDPVTAKEWIDGVVIGKYLD
jgi:hypothetical protein